MDTKQQLRDNNTLIAQFMGVKETEDFYISYEQKIPCWKTTNGIISSNVFTVPDKSFNDFISQARYHDSWEWLHQVIDKIEILFSQYPVFDPVHDKEHMVFMDVIAIPIASKIDEVYKRVLQFIKWYSNQPQKAS